MLLTVNNGHKEGHTWKMDETCLYGNSAQEDIYLAPGIPLSIRTVIRFSILYTKRTRFMFIFCHVKLYCIEMCSTLFNYMFNICSPLSQSLYSDVMILLNKSCFMTSLGAKKKQPVNVDQKSLPSASLHPITPSHLGHLQFFGNARG